MRLSAQAFRFDRFLKAANRALSLYTLKNQANALTAVTVPDPVADPEPILYQIGQKMILLSRRCILPGAWATM